MKISFNSTGNRSGMSIVENFTLMFCHFVDFPDGGIDCSVSNPNKCVKCKVEGRFLAGAPTFIYFLWVILIATSIIGIINNILIIVVIRHRETNKSFDFLLTFLACVDLIVSLMAASGGTANTAYFGNWSENKSRVMSWSYISLYTREIARSTSSFVTLVICAKHLLMISFPLKAPSWFTIRSTQAYCVGCVVIAHIFGIPRFLSYSMVDNMYKDIPSLKNLDYIAKPTYFGKIVYQKLHGLHNKIDYWLPPPLILLTVLLSYIQVRQISKRRQKLTSKEKSGIRAERMFLPVAICCVVTNMVPIINIWMMTYGERAYRELFLIMFISNATNSAVNFPIYYYRSLLFKHSTQEVIWELKKKLGFRVGEKYETTGMTDYNKSDTDNRLSVGPTTDSDL